jgi:cellulose synthase/poly-beta-1,6-N-acetylglucosamine synthase-like glycosyltransferase
MAAVIPLPEDLSLEAAAAVVLVGSVALILYAYVGYAGIMWVLARVRPQPVRKRRIEPTVTVLVVAYNEAGRIERRISNLLALEYPRDRLEIVVASDGSTDDTVERAEAAGRSQGVRVVAFPVRRGKPAVLNDVIPSLRSEVVVLADARQQFAPAAVAALVECLGDQTVGAVSGELVLVKGAAVDAVGAGAAAYWSYEKFIRRAESAVDSTVGATGAIYAIRRALFDPIPTDTILDDVLIPMRIARQGHRVVFEPRAVAYDHVPAAPHDEFVRKVRTIAGNAQLFARERWLLQPRDNRLWPQTISHKAIRLLLPGLYAGAFVSNLALTDILLFQLTLATQVLFYLSAASVFAVPALRKPMPLLVVPYEICLLNWAAVIGIVRYATRRQAVTWERSSVGAAS